MGCDFFVFSAHKMLGPTGIGVLWARESLLENMDPFLGGGDMINTVSVEKTTWADLPVKFEAGTPSIADAIGLGEAIQYLDRKEIQAASIETSRLLDYATQEFQKIPGLRILGPEIEKTPIVSFTIKGIHPSDLGSLIDQEGIAIRTGHHCTQPLLRKLGLTSTARASFSIYNTQDEVDFFVEAVLKAKGLLQ